MIRILHLIAAARPNFMKVAPLFHALARETAFRPAIVHTGQHYDANMSDAFFRDLGLPAPHHHLGIGSGSHAEQTGGVMIAYEKLCGIERPNLTIVVGDVNSTMACAIAAKKLGITVAHLEAGLRSRDWTMPEEINRLVTDSISDILWTPSEDADANLAREGCAPERIVRVGNVMIDSYEMMRPAIEAAGIRAEFGLAANNYAVVTLHRPSNVDNRDSLAALVGLLRRIAAKLPIVFALHPRTLKTLEQYRLFEALAATPGIRLSEPLNYIRFMALVREARVAITDSGGVQEETTYLGVPCLTLRENTERPITVTLGTNRLVKPNDVEPAVESILAGTWPRGTRPPLWDGRASERIVADIKRRR